MKFGSFIPFMMVALCLCSCKRRPLEDPDYYTRIKVDINIENVQNVTCDIYNPDIVVPAISPEVMHVLFYNAAGDELLAESFISSISSKDGVRSISGDISILPGDYRVVAYQFGEEHSLVDEQQNYESIRAYTDLIPENEVKNLLGQSLRCQPEHIVSACSDRQSIPYHDGIYTIEMEATTLVESYYLQVGVNGAEYISSARAVLTSMAHGKGVTSRQVEIDNPCSINIPLITSKDNGSSVVCNVFNTFGRIPGGVNELYLDFDIVTSDGTRVEKKYDITKLFKSELCVKHHWLLIDDIIDIPKPITPPTPGGGGFDPTVRDWEEEHYDVTM